jgi:uncharacterized protein YqeY
MPTVYEHLRADIVTAMKARDTATATALRTADAAIQEFEKGGRSDLVAANEAEIRVLEKYLPKGIDGARLEALIAETIQESGDQSRKEMGKVIGALKKRPDAALIDFAAASKLIQAKLP